MNPEQRTLLPNMAFTGFISRYRPPQVSEGFEDITEIKFQASLLFHILDWQYLLLMRHPQFQGTDQEWEIWSRYWIWIRDCNETISKNGDDRYSLGSIHVRRTLSAGNVLPSPALLIGKSCKAFAYLSSRATAALLSNFTTEWTVWRSTETSEKRVR